MTMDAVKPVLAPSTAEIAFVWLQRGIALYCLVFGVLYWVKLLGFHTGALWRFDLMPLHWQVASVCLAVFFPFAAIGLWTTASWGVVVWLICAAAETAMYLFYPQYFGRRLPIVGSHLLAFAAYAAMWGWLFVQRRREGELA